MTRAAPLNRKIEKKATMPAAGWQVRTVVEEARHMGLLEGEKLHVSFRAPKALVEAAMRDSGVENISELCVLGLARLVQTDRAVKYMLENFGKLGPDHTLDY